MSTITDANVRPAAPLRLAQRIDASGFLGLNPMAGAVVSIHRVRLTRRGRLVVSVSGLFLALVAAFGTGGDSAASESSGRAAPTRVIMVEPGDTLWATSADIADDGEVRTTIAEIQRLNGLDTPDVRAGQRIRVPVTD
jgi:LysM repeat protein